MSLTLFYITNRPEIASIADSAGVDRVFIDMEYIGKQDRQAGMDTVQNCHTIGDIVKVKSILHDSELLVRINPIHDKTYNYSSTETEVDEAIDAGADVLMLPMYKTQKDVERFLSAVNGRVKTMLLCETPQAVNIMTDIVKIRDVDEIHIGLNDLHLALGKKFMFELIADGTVDAIADLVRPSSIRFGFGGIARIGYGDLPAEKIIAEHYRLGSEMAILSRSFCNADRIKDLEEVQNLFNSEVRKIRNTEAECAQYTSVQFSKNHEDVVRLTNKIVESVKQ